MGDDDFYVMPEDDDRTKGHDAQAMNIMAGKMVAETVRTTLGPKGMDKMLVDSDNEVIVTNDGVTILEEMNIENPTARMIVEIAKTQEEEVGDGTTTAVVIAGELLKQAEELLDQGIHPTVVCKGYRKAAGKSKDILEELGKQVSLKDDELLSKVSQTAMTGKGAEASKEFLSELVIKAVETVAEETKNGVEVDKDNVKIEWKVGGNVENSELVEGIVLDKKKTHPRMKDKVKDAKVALLSSSIEIKNTETDTQVSINNPDQLKDFMEMEEDMLKEMADNLADRGVNAIFCKKGIDDLAAHHLAKQGVLAVRRVPKSELEKIAKATGAKIVNDVKNVKEEDLGRAGVVEQKKTGEDEMIYISDCPEAKAVTLVLRGSTEHVITEIKRAVEDALGDVASAVKSGRVVAGGGSVETELSQALGEEAEKTKGKEQLAVQAFADALEVIPKTLAENSGLDPIEVLTNLRSAHEKGNQSNGIDVFTGEITNCWKEGVVEPLQIKTQAVSSASEVAVMILRIDDVISAGGSERKKSRPSSLE